MKSIQLTFTRKYDTKLEAFAIIEIQSIKTIDRDQALVKLKTATTQWALNTESGHKALEYAGGDLNIGDLASYIEEDASLQDSFNKLGLSLSVVSVNKGELITTEQAIPYDTVLINSP